MSGGEQPEDEVEVDFEDADFDELGARVLADGGLELFREPGFADDLDLDPAPGQQAAESTPDEPVAPDAGAAVGDAVGDAPAREVAGAEHGAIDVDIEEVLAQSGADVAEGPGMASGADVEAADDLEALSSSLPPPASEPIPMLDPVLNDEFPARPLRVIMVGGARGGVGKTVLAANLGLYLATIGRRVVLVDADPGGANLHTCLGTSQPPALTRLRRNQRGDGPPVPDEALQETPFRGLRLLHLGLDEPVAAASRADRMSKMIGRLRDLNAEYVVVDLGVGLAKEMLDNFLSGDISVFVTVPEPTAIENTYRFLRGVFARYLLTTLPDDESRAEIERITRALGGAPAPLDLLRELEDENHPLASAARSAMETFHPHVVINQTRLRADLQLGYSMHSAARRRLGIGIDYLGHIDNDDTVWTCVRNRRPLLLEVPGAKSSRRIEKIARRLLMLEAGKQPAPIASGVPLDSYHDLLEVERGATDEEVRRAYKRCREVYAHDALCCYGLLEAHEIEKLRARVDEAFDVLLDPARRRPYEASVFPEQPEPVREAPPEEIEEPTRPAPEIAPDTPFTGELLKQVRESQRISLRDISQRTKISLNYLKAIEDDDFGRLPAVVYTTGFVAEFARFLKLDPQQVSRTYVSRYKRYIDDRERVAARKH